MDKDTVLRHFNQAGALLEGHFVLSSGRHSASYLQCARVLMNPERAEKLCCALADKIQGHFGIDQIDIIVAPAMGGLIAGYEVARQLCVESIFTERVNGSFVLRRGFSIAEGSRVLVIEDVVTTGKSSRECIDVIKSCGGNTIGVGCLVDRSAGTAKGVVGLEPISLIALDIPTYSPDNVPDELQQKPIEKPGSRFQKS